MVEEAHNTTAMPLKKLLYVVSFFFFLGVCVYVCVCSDVHSSTLACSL